MATNAEDEKEFENLAAYESPDEEEGDNQGTGATAESKQVAEKSKYDYIVQKLRLWGLWTNSLHLETHM